ncbi:MAG: putative zinc-binding peptidase [Caldilineaceae bacterium]|nr:putative zinc-binding peptidase [Caldilineaceae bacterium]
MKLFKCQNCDQLLYFENTRCERCGYALGYLWEERELSALTPADNGLWQALANPTQRYRYCANAEHDACNWLVPADGPESLCLACQLNNTIPNLNNPDHLAHWRKLELAKHRLIYALLRFRLPVLNRTIDPELGLAFDFLANEGEVAEQGGVITGHADGLITINVAEADDAERERVRQMMEEPYRTLLGHFRHEVGHYYWQRFARSDAWRQAFRAQFGDEQQDYAQALSAHYAQNDEGNWQANFVSHYASAHPWEDWAETWAHYLHMVDSLETAYAFGMRVRPQIKSDENLAVTVDFNAYNQPDFDMLIEAWLPVTYALNSLNRSMGHLDLYPFVLSPTVLAKMRFVHDSIHTTPA